MTDTSKSYWAEFPDGRLVSSTHPIDGGTSLTIDAYNERLSERQVQHETAKVTSQAKTDATEAARVSGLAKLVALGLTEEEAKAMTR